MPTKYECPECGRRFTEWGAEKLGFKCPQDDWASTDHPDDVELVPVGGTEETSPKKPSLKRRTKRIAPVEAKPLMDEDEALASDGSDLEEEEEETDEGEEEVAVDDEEKDDDQPDAVVENDEEADGDDDVDFDDDELDDDSVIESGDEDWEE